MGDRDKIETEPMRGAVLTSSARNELMTPPDGRYGWAICAVSGYIMFVGVGTLMCYGVLYVEFLKYFEEGRTKTSWIGGLCWLSLACSGPLSSNLTNRFGHRLTVMLGGLLAAFAMLISAFATSIFYLYVSFGLLGGIGFGLAWIPSISIVALYFDKKRSLAIGVATSCGGVSFLIFPIMVDVFIEMLSWRGTVIVLACLWLQTCVCGAIMRPLVQRKGIYLLCGQRRHKQSSAGGRTGCKCDCDVGIFQVWQFWIYVIFVEYLMRVDFLTFLIIIPDYAVLNGHDLKRATLLLTFYGAVSIPARWLGGFIADRPRVNELLFLSLSIAGLSITSLVLPFTVEHFAGTAVVCAFRGAVSGVLEVLQPTVLILLFGEKRFTTTLGYDMAAIDIGQLTAGPLAGIIYDTTGNYLVSFMMCSSICMIAAVFAFALFLNSRQACAR